VIPHRSHLIAYGNPSFCIHCLREWPDLLVHCATPQTAGGASTRDQAISQAPPTREGPRGRHQTTPVDVPAPPLPTTEETP
jgi:hypothetical protein